jgi:translation elongation factor EF-Ts
MGSMITHSINPLEGIIRMLKFTTLKEKTISNSKFKEFCQNITTICDTQNINSIIKFKHLIYNKDHDIESYIESLNKEMEEDIKITDLTICSLPSVIEKAYFECYNTESKDVNQGASVAFTCKAYTDEVKKFITELLVHIGTYKPLVAYENQLLESVINYVKKESWNSPKKISIEHYFLPEVVLELQNISSENLIRDLLNKYQIDIVDYDYI